MNRNDYQVANLLRRARRLIELPQNWIQGDIAQHVNGSSLSIESPEATKFCAIGAICRAGSRFPEGSVDHAVAALASIAGVLKSRIVSSLDVQDSRFDDEVVVDFNDSHDHAVVLAMFDLAIHRITSRDQVCLSLPTLGARSVDFWHADSYAI